jgi:uncharacterized protein YjgD (DUF1641 family)
MSLNSNSVTMNETLSQVLSEPDVQSALVTALQKLPAAMETLTELENLSLFAKNVLADKESLQSVVSGLQSDLPQLNFDKESLDALFALVNKLPKFVELLTAVEPMIEFVRAVLDDRTSLENLVHSAQSVVHPVTATLQSGTELLQAAKQRAGADRSPVNVFSLMKLLRDPNVQYGVHFVQAALGILQERQEKATRSDG